MEREVSYMRTITRLQEMIAENDKVLSEKEANIVLRNEEID